LECIISIVRDYFIISGTFVSSKLNRGAQWLENADNRPWGGEDTII